MDATRYQQDIEVYSQDQLALRSERYVIEVEFDDETVRAYDGGDERTNDQLLDWGIYLVAVVYS